MRIVEVIPSLVIGGAEVFVLELSEALRSRGHEVELLCVSEAGPLIGRMSDTARAHLHVATRRTRFDPLLPVDLSSYLRRIKPDIVHTHLFTSLLWGATAAKLAGSPPVIHTQHGVHDEPEALVPHVRRALSHTLAAYVGCSQAVIEDAKLRGYAPEGKLHLIENGIDVKRFRTPSCEHEPMRLITVGRLVPIKGQDLLIDAVASLHRDGLDVALTIVGDGPSKPDLTAQIARHGLEHLVTLAGLRDDIPELLAEHDVFVMPSRSEAMPIAMLEAAATGLPLIATDVGGNATLLKQSEGGLVVAPENVDELVRAIARLALFDPAQLRNTGHFNRELVRKSYSLTHTAKSYETLFEACIRDLKS